MRYTAMMWMRRANMAALGGGADIMPESYEKVCPRCRRVCFSPEQFADHECFDAADMLNAEIALTSSDNKLCEICGAPLLKYEPYGGKCRECYEISNTR